MSIRQFGAFCNAQLENLIGERPAVVHHYTSVASAASILRSGNLRASCATHLNDVAEVAYAASIFWGHVDRAYALEHDESVLPLFEALRKHRTSVDQSPLYLLSFSDKCDDSRMWRLYSERGRGCSLEVPVSALTLGHGQLVRCHYSASCGDTVCRDGLAEIRRIFMADLAAGEQPNPAEYADLYFHHAQWFAPMFKAHVWADEWEWRLFFLNPLSRQSDDGRRYFEYPQQGHIEITHVRLGPHCGPEAIDTLTKAMIGTPYRADILLR